MRKTPSPMIVVASLCAVLSGAACLEPAATSTPQENPPMPTPLSLESIRIAPRTASARPPLLVLLHGVGANEEGLAQVAPRLDPRFIIRSVRAPNVIGAGQYAWFALRVSPDGTRHIDAAQAESSRAAVLRFIDEAVAADGADPERVYVAGFSQGGILAMSIALTAPEKVAGAINMSGRILPEIAPLTATTERLAGLPILVVHGTADQKLTIDHGHASRDLLATLPVALTYAELPMGHAITAESLAVVAPWLSARLDGPRRLASTAR